MYRQHTRIAESMHLRGCFLQPHPFHCTVFYTVLQSHGVFMAVPEGGDMGKAQCFQHGGGFCYFVSHVFAAVAVGTDGDAGAAQLPVMA